MWPGIFALIAIVLFALAAVRIGEPRVRLEMVAAGFFTLAVFWPAITALGS